MKKISRQLSRQQIMKDPSYIKQELSIDAMAETVVMLMRAVEEGKEIVKKEQE